MRSTRSNNLVSHLLKGSFTNSATPFFFEQKMHYLPKKKTAIIQKYFGSLKKKYRGNNNLI